MRLVKMVGFSIRNVVLYNFCLILLISSLLTLMCILSPPKDKFVMETVHLNNLEDKKLTSKYTNSFEIDLLQEAIKAKIVKPAYQGKIFRTGCYLYLSGGKSSRHMAPPHLRELLNCSRQLPSALIVGVKKCGTTTLSTFLGLHPEVEDVKEVEIEEYQASLDEALKLLKGMPYVTPGMIVLSDYPGYSEGNRERLFEIIPFLGQNVKIIFILKDPTKRAHSDFDHMKILSGRNVPSKYRKHSFKDNVLRKTFKDTVLFQNGSVNQDQRLVQLGMYAKTIQLFMTKFPVENILVLDGEDFAENPVKTLKFLENELHLSPFFTNEHFVYKKSKKYYCSNVPSRPDQYCMSKNKGRKHRDIPEWLLLKLNQFYEPYNRKLKQLLRATFHNDQPFDWLEVNEVQLTS